MNPRWWSCFGYKLRVNKIVLYAIIISLKIWLCSSYSHGIDGFRYCKVKYLYMLIYSSTGNFLSPILVSDWLTFCVEFWYFIKKKCICKPKAIYFTLRSPPLTRDVTCSKLCRYGENMGDKKFSVEHTLSRNQSQIRALI